VYNRIIITFSEIFLNVDFFLRLGSFKIHSFVRMYIFFVKVMLSLWVYSAELSGQDLIPLVLFMVDATKSQLPHHYCKI